MKLAVLTTLATVGLGAALGPSECLNFRTLAVSDTAAVLKWDEPASPPSTGYLVHCRVDGDATWTRLSGRNDFELSIDYVQLTPDTTYGCRCRGWSIGESPEKSTPVYSYVSTPLPDAARSGIPGNPVGIMATQSTDSTIRFEWGAPVDGGVATGYDVEYRHGPDRRNYGPYAIAGTNQPETWVDLSGIPAESAVQIKVKARNGEGVQTVGTGAWAIGYTGPANVVEPTPESQPAGTLAPVPQGPIGPIPSVDRLRIHGGGRMHSVPIFFPASDNMAMQITTDDPGMYIGSRFQNHDGTHNVLQDSGFYFVGMQHIIDAGKLVTCNTQKVDCTPDLVMTWDFDYENQLVSNPQNATWSDSYAGRIIQTSHSRGSYWLQSTGTTVREYSVSGSTLTFIREITLAQSIPDITTDGHMFFAVTQSDSLVMMLNSPLCQPGGNTYAEFDMSGAVIGGGSFPNLQHGQSVAFSWNTGAWTVGQLCPGTWEYSDFDAEIAVEESPSDDNNFVSAFVL